jgi:hypothetical protein
MGGPTSRLLLRFAVWREEDFMRQCGNDSEVIARSFRDGKRIDFASLRPRALTAIFGLGLERFQAKWLPVGVKKTRQNKNKRRNSKNALCREQR